MRLNLQNKEDELTNTKGQLKEAKETIQVNNENIEKLSSEVVTLNKDLEKEKETNLRKVSIMESAHSSACEKLQKVIEAKDEVIGGKEVSIMELNNNIAELNENISEKVKQIDGLLSNKDSLESQVKSLTTSLNETQCKLGEKEESLEETSGLLQQCR